MIYQIEHRPTNFNDVVGNQNIVDTVSSWFTVDPFIVPRVIIFHSELCGVGKTTLALLIANKLLEDQKNKFVRVTAPEQVCCSDLMDINKTQESPIKAVRELVNKYNSPPLTVSGKIPKKVVIFDEFHVLSQQAQDVFNFLFEDEKKSWLTFIITTTRLSKISKAIRSRSVCYELKGVSIPEITSVLTKQCVVDNLKYDNQDVLIKIAEQAYGSVRTAITILNSCVKNGNIILQDFSKEEDLEAKITTVINALINWESKAYDEDKFRKFANEEILATVKQYCNNGQAHAFYFRMLQILLKKFDPLDSKSTLTAKKFIGGHKQTTERLLALMFGFENIKTTSLIESNELLTLSLLALFARILYTG